MSSSRAADAFRRPRARADDVFRLDDTLSELELRDRVRAFGEELVLPIINDCWERAEFPFELIAPLADLGVVGGIIEGYGCPGLSRRAAGIVARELARAAGSLNTFFGVHSGLAMGAIALLGSEEQKQRWLPPMAPWRASARSRSPSPTTVPTRSRSRRARREGDKWVLDGRRRWIGERAIWQAEITLEGVRLPAGTRLDHARSFRDTSRVLAATRGGAAWECVGHGMACVEAAVGYAAERAKLICSEARDILAGNGLLQENHVARHMTDMEIVDPYEGTDSIQSLILGRALTGISAFT